MTSPTASSIVELIAREHPKLHRDAAGEVVDWGLAVDALERLGAVVQHGFVTAETGAGLSTVVLGAASRKHFAVCPDGAELERISAFLRAHHLPDAITPLIESSDTALPRLPDFLGADRLDLALIDGAHRHPFPFLDCHYFAGCMKPGGIMIVDDIQIPSVHLLVDYLKQDELWSLDAVTGKTAWFTKLREEEPVNDWAAQTINRQPLLDGTAIPSAAVLKRLLRLKIEHVLSRRWPRLYAQIRRVG